MSDGGRSGISTQPVSVTAGPAAWIGVLQSAGADSPLAVSVVDARILTFGSRGAAPVLAADAQLIEHGISGDAVRGWALRGVDTSGVGAVLPALSGLSVDDLVDALDTGVPGSALREGAALGLPYLLVKACWQVALSAPRWEQVLLELAHDGALTLPDMEFARQVPLTVEPPRVLPGRRLRHDLLDLPAGPARDAYLLVVLRDGDQDRAWRLSGLLSGRSWAATVVRLLLDGERDLEEAVRTSILLDDMPEDLGVLSGVRLR